MSPMSAGLLGVAVVAVVWALPLVAVDVPEAWTVRRAIGKTRREATRQASRRGPGERERQP